MTVACIIPARFNSSRFPGKLLAKAQGKTVLQHTFEKAQACDGIDALYVATDDERIRSHVLEIGGKVLWTSPECQNGTERILNALENHPELVQSSFIVNLQGDHPCTNPDTIDSIVKILKSDPNAVMSTAVTKIYHLEDYLSPHIVKCVFDSFFNALYFSRSPIPYHRPKEIPDAHAHIGIYCYKTDFLKKLGDKSLTPLQKSEDLEQLKVLENGHRIKIAVVEETILGVDTPNDLKKLEEYLCQLNISL